MLFKNILIHTAQKIGISVNQMNLFDNFSSSCLRSFIFAPFENISRCRPIKKNDNFSANKKQNSIHHLKPPRIPPDLVKHRDNVLDNQNYWWNYNRKMFYLFRTVPSVLLLMMHWIKLIHVLVPATNCILRYTLVELQIYICVSYSLIVSFWVV